MLTSIDVLSRSIQCIVFFYVACTRSVLVLRSECVLTFLHFNCFIKNAVEQVFMEEENWPKVKRCVLVP